MVRAGVWKARNRHASVLPTSAMRRVLPDRRPAQRRRHHSSLGQASRIDRVLQAPVQGIPARPWPPQTRRLAQQRRHKATRATRTSTNRCFPSGNTPRGSKTPLVSGDTEARSQSNVRVEAATTRLATRKRRLGRAGYCCAAFGRRSALGVRFGYCQRPTPTTPTPIRPSSGVARRWVIHHTARASSGAAKL